MGEQPQDQVDYVLAPRGGDNRPVSMFPARWDGHRSVRLLLPHGDIGLTTTTYSYSLTHDERAEVARRLAALWNLAVLRGWRIDDIEAALEDHQ